MSTVTMSLSLCIDSMFVLFSFVSCMVPVSVHHTPIVMVYAKSVAVAVGFRGH